MAKPTINDEDALAVLEEKIDVLCGMLQGFDYAEFRTDWAVRETVRARLRVMVRTLLRRYKYPPDRQEEATDTVLKQAESLSNEWAASA